MSLEGRKREVRYYIREFFKRLILKGYTFFYRSKNKKYRDQIFIVYSMRKVGSTSVFRSLFNNIPGIKIFHLHDLSDSFFKLMGKEDPYNSRLKKGKEVIKAIKNNPEKRLKIISVVRDPVAVEVSDIFHTLKYSRNARKRTKLDVPSLLGEIEKKGYQYAINWFESEFNEYLEMNIYDHDFDKEKGYAIIKDERFDILVLKLETIRGSIQQAMEEFIGIQDFELTHFNKTSNEKLGQLYADLKIDFSVQNQKLNEVYDSRFARHFFTDTEIAGFKKKWSGE